MNKTISVMPRQKVLNAEDVINDIKLNMNYKMDSHYNYIVISKNKK